MVNRYIVFIWGAILMAILQTALAGELKLWYESPAPEWLEGLPVGNGSLMAVALGGVHQETIQLNEETLWSGHLVERDNPEGAAHLDQIRQLMFDGQYYEAEQLVKENMIGRSLEFGRNAYQSLGDLKLSFHYADVTDEITDYHRELDLETATIRISYKVGNTGYSREIFSSAADQALIIRLSCDRPGGLDFITELNRPGARLELAGSDRIVMTGMATYPPDPEWRGVHFESQLQFEIDGGEAFKRETDIHIKGADTVIMKLVAATDYRGIDPHRTCELRMASLIGKKYGELEQAHVADYQELFKRVDIKLGNSAIKKVRTNLFHGKAPVETLPTNKRIAAIAQGVEDPQMVELYFQYGRYILISTSRPGNIAVNLWGKWVNSFAPSYDADYHTNINIPMNYWPAGVCNLTECHTPFFDLIDSLRANGRISAERTYGCGGFVAHHATDHSYFTAAIGAPPHGMWPLTPAWGCHQMWQHYLFTQDLKYLEEHSYPVIKEAAEFFVDYLVEDPASGYLVSGPSCSPENRFITPDGKTASLSMGPTMDMQLIRDLFSNCIAASEELNRDKDFRRKLEKMLPLLLPMQIGEDGRLLEWALPFEEHDPGHKHISHLWGLLEGNQITPDGTPELAEAARKSLDLRVELGTAKTQVFRAMTSWVLSAYNRLWDGEESYRQLRYIIGQSSTTNLMATSYQGMNRLMWETDANLGATMGIAEMFLQSHAGCIHLLPALPSALDNGTIKGLLARGAFEVDLEWSEGALVSLSVHSLKGGVCTLRYGEKRIEFQTGAGQEYHFDKELEQRRTELIL